MARARPAAAADFAREHAGPRGRVRDPSLVTTRSHLAATPAGHELLSLGGEATQGKDVLRSRLRAVEEARRGGRQTRGEGQSAQVADDRSQGK